MLLFDSAFICVTIEISVEDIKVPKKSEVQPVCQTELPVGLNWEVDKMAFPRTLNHMFALGLSVSMFAALAVSARAAGPEVVSGPAAQPECFSPWSADTKFFKFPKKDGKFRIALANGYIANTWRIQMIQTAKAYAAQPEVAAKLAELLVTTGVTVAAWTAATLPTPSVVTRMLAGFKSR